jgi:hypothetical protein
VTEKLLSRGVEVFCSQHGLKGPYQIQPIHGGRNSRVSKLINEERNWILKEYFPADSNKIDRLGVEFNFLVFLKGQRVTGVPKPIDMDRVLHCALYSYLPGHRLQIIKEKHIDQAANFIGMINSFRDHPEAFALPLAADACLSWQEHINLTEARISRLIAMKPTSALELDAYAFITKQLLPLWSSLKSNLLHQLASNDLKKYIPLEERILSPSDFGFHNTIENNDRLSFVDFEYAGWDDPCKLICDFLCQPELPVSAKQGKKFINEMLRTLSHPHPESVLQRVQKLLPIHRLKWCCILLNEFILVDRQRRLYAGLKSKDMMFEQLSKTKMYFKEYLDTAT